MAEHHVARCEHDIRHVRKELQRWGRNMLIFLGLEEIAESLVGPERWTWLKTTYDQCRSDLPSCDPSEEASCHDHCAGSTRHAAFLHGTGDSQQQRISQLSEQQCKMEREQQVIGAQENDDGQEEPAAAALKSPVGPPESPAIISPAATAERAAHLSNLETSDDEIKKPEDDDDVIDVDVEGPPGLVRKSTPVSMHCLLDDDEDEDEDDVVCESEEDDDDEEVLDQPLDLSVKSNSSSASASPNPASESPSGVETVDGVINLVKGRGRDDDSCVNGGWSEFSVKNINGRLESMASATTSPATNNSNNGSSSPSSSAAGLNPAQRRTYSDADLQAALKEIRSGQLGTRKASIIYGVPRSTLRNKVYKLQAHDRRLLASNSHQMDAVEVDVGKKSPVLDWYDGSSHVVMRGGFNPVEVAGRLAALPFPPFSANLEPRPITDENRSPVDRRRQLSGATTTSSAESCPSPASSSVEVSLKDVIARTVASRLAKATVVKAPEPRPPPTPPSSNNNRNSRPKRGKYRNYDQQNLLQAVKAVQRGEMSVHRAGTFYGVPHSTLEYKVKERHLMRPRKRPRKDENGSVPTGPPIVPINGTKFVSKTTSEGRPDDSSSSSESEASPEKRTPEKGLFTPPSFLPGAFTAPYGLPPPPPYLFWSRASLPPPPLPLPQFPRWFSPDFGLQHRLESGLTFEEAKKQWLKKFPEDGKKDGSYSEDLKAAIVAMETEDDDA